MNPIQSLAMRAIRPFWRMRRGLTLGAQGMVRDGEGRVLLVRHGYHPGWHFPGGGVEWGETALQALARELREETGVVVTGTPKLHGLFGNFSKFPGDHIAMYVVDSWQRPSVPASTIEIRETGFFPLKDLPAETSDPTRQRCQEIAGNVAVRDEW